jgi:hypothetical protein
VNVRFEISEESFNRRKIIFGIDEWYWNKRLDYPFVRIADEQQEDAYSWCQENFGENWIWASPIQTDYTDVYFLQPEDALLFRLRFNTLTTT